MNLNSDPLSTAPASLSKKINIYALKDIIFTGADFFEKSLNLESSQIKWLKKEKTEVLKNQTICFFEPKEISFELLHKTLSRLSFLSHLAGSLLKFQKASPVVDIIISLKALALNLNLSSEDSFYLEEIKKITTQFGSILHENILNFKEMEYKIRVQGQNAASFQNNSYIGLCCNEAQLSYLLKHSKTGPLPALFYPDTAPFLHQIPPSIEKGFFGNIELNHFDDIIKQNVQFVIPRSLSMPKGLNFDFSIS